MGLRGNLFGINIKGLSSLAKYIIADLLNGKLSKAEVI
jgi:hypothetical protein